MDLLVKKASGRYNVPRVPFIHRGGNFVTEREILASPTWFRTFDFRKCLVQQPMTYLGHVEGSLTGTWSNYEGIDSKFLTDGLITMGTIRDTLREWLGRKKSAIHCNEAGQWSWCDNHVGLLVNMLRYALLKKISESNEDGGLSGHWDDLVDGDDKLVLDSVWNEEYPEGGDMEWPMGDEINHFPEYRKIEGYVAETGDPAIDLRGLSEDGQRFVLYMCAQWNRQSRYRLDFNLPKLASVVLYRSEDGSSGPPVPELISWYIPDRDGNKTDKPALISSHEAWLTMSSFVSLNCLEAQLRVATVLVLKAFCQYLPITKDGAVWTQTRWSIVLPRLEAIRGRYPFLAARDQPLDERRSNAERSFIASGLETLNFAGIVLCQAMLYGLWVRSDKEFYYRGVSSTSVAATSVIDSEIKLPGMSGLDIRSKADGKAMTSWPIPGIPVYVREAKGVKGFPIFSDSYCLDYSEFNCRGDRLRMTMPEAWKTKTLFKLMGWELDVCRRRAKHGGLSFFVTFGHSVVSLPPKLKEDKQTEEYDEEEMLVSNFRKADASSTIVPIPIEGLRDIKIIIEVSNVGEYIRASLNGVKERVYG